MKTDGKIFVDADSFIALTIQTDSNHQKAVALLHALLAKPVQFFTSNYVFSESITVISQQSSHAIAIKYIEDMKAEESPFQIKRVGEAEEEEAIRVFKAQTSKNTSFVDCTNMVLMKWLNLDAIFSFDEVYRKKGFPLIEDFLKASAPTV